MLVTVLMHAASFSAHQSAAVVHQRAGKFKDQYALIQSKFLKIITKATAPVFTFISAKLP